MDGSVEAVARSFPSVRVIVNDENRGFAAANNQAFAHMTGRYALLLNSDAYLTEGAVDTLHRFMEATPGAAMACGQLLNDDGTKQNSFAVFPSFASILINESALQLVFPRAYPSKRQEHRDPVEVDSCIGACMIVRATAMDAVGWLDERYFFFLEETDWAYRMRRAGWKVFLVPGARIHHSQGKSVGADVRARMLFYGSRYRYFDKWHPNLRLLVPAVTTVRVLVNTILNGAGTLVTLGLHAGVRRKLGVYGALLLWHLRGCPDIRGR